MTQISVHLGDDVDAGEALRFCLAIVSDARFVGAKEIRLARSRVDVWSEPDDGPGELHVAIPEMSKQGMAALGSLLFHLTQRYARTGWTLDD
ncbi:hypothetical protein [Subtercola sp. Z020]|uniref:hypothetical protein n=1 Tax=Subtercola sp. Z020 TaxID=2080582 RepID=UPI0011B03A24|nr:hypothetical protein [Subtercola sp. Z020]